MPEDNTNDTDRVKRKTTSGVLSTVVAIVLAIACFSAGAITHDLTAGKEPTGQLTAVAYRTDAVLSLQTTSARGVHHRCTATLIKPDWAVTAAHCVTKPPDAIEEQRSDHCEGKEQATDGPPEPIDPQTAQFIVRGDTTEYSSGGETAGVLSIHVVPGWKWAINSGARHDLALLRLNRTMATRPVKIASTVPANRTWTLVTGWATPPSRCGNIYPTMQQWPVQTTKKCPAYTKPFEVCGTTNGLVAPCEGVSGGPMFTLANGQQPQIIGVYSAAWGDYCGEGPGVYTVVSEYRKFIDDTIAAAS